MPSNFLPRLSWHPASLVSGEPCHNGTNRVHVWFSDHFTSLWLVMNNIHLYLLRTRLLTSLRTVLAAILR